MAARLTAYVVVGIVAATLIAGLIVGAQRDDTDGPVDIIVHNAKVYTAGTNGTMAEAVAIRGNQILRVGSEREVTRLRKPQTTMIDAKGAAVLPGFNDAHVHFINGGLGLERIDLADADTVDEVQSRIRTWASQPRRRPLGAGPRVVLPTLPRWPADSTAARYGRLRSPGPDHQLRRSHLVGEHPGPAAGPHHEEDPEPARGCHRQGSENWRANRRPQRGRDGARRRSRAKDNAR